ncbi:dual specificity protein phosphatase 19 [Planococcus citri]|uniref:dual specificity protein phosphatase 19 n=1 Tax=Planococcus citri TaxID=170843 RepID=UPI0031F88FC3
MSLQENIEKKLNTLKATTVKLYSNTGEVYEEYRDESGELRKNKLNTSSCGYVVDHTPDLQIGKVLPWIYIGSQDVAHDHNMLKENGITHILSIGVPCPTYDDISTTFIEAYDTEEFDIKRTFDVCFEIIDGVRESSGIVLVHCNAGISRSATIVAAYLIRHRGINHEEALEILKKERPKINPNPGFVKVLENYATAYSRKN